ncbi:hypothetical protein [Paraglaciecola marina]|uniref:hypothetical protein n=1 Tax=Paraglaciecola marina TaxID=2500157 RepID=UPI00106043AA|nr:hypothetical protein [Paraglaciecola marina]
MAKGIWYPQYSEVLGGDKTSYTHLDIAKGLMDEKALLSNDEASTFLKSLHQKASEIPNLETVIISAETLLRGKIGKNKKKWTRLQNFQALLKEYLSDFTDIEVVVTFRNYIDYLESLYNEHVKATTYAKSITSFHEEFRERFNYRAIVSTWEQNVGKVKVIAFSELTQGNMVENWINLALGEGISSTLNLNVKDENASWPLPLVDIKKKINAYNDYQLSKLTRHKLNQFSKSDYCKDNLSDKRTWLETNFKLQFVESYEADRDWLVANYNLECASLCEITDLNNNVYQGLMESDWLEFLKFNINE